MKYIICFSLLVLSTFSEAFARENDTSTPETGPSFEWQITSLELEAVRGFGKDNGQSVLGELLHVKNTKGPGDIVFNCMGGRLLAAISLDETPAAKALSKSWDKPKMTTASVVIRANGEEVIGHEKWYYLRKTKVIVPRSEVGVRHFYNMVVKGDEITAEAKGKTHSVPMPRPNKSFNEWGAECGIGRLAKDAQTQVEG